MIFRFSSNPWAGFWVWNRTATDCPRCRPPPLHRNRNLWGTSQPPRSCQPAAPHRTESTFWPNASRFPFPLPPNSSINTHVIRRTAVCSENYSRPSESSLFNIPTTGKHRAWSHTFPSDFLYLKKKLTHFVPPFNSDWLSRPQRRCDWSTGLSLI